ncbi:S-layer homology domain-containing protein [Pseudanabaenaceae cyanobacterium LEGE 13415]|nr:S-layer homology domain-containing protein [Pseudanabaenaceae cyanobacterium LEGE 13415]
MTNLRRNTFVRNAAIVGASITAGSVALLSTISTPLKAQNASFPDTQNYWAQPFIAALAERNIVRGYPDGRFRPDETVDRDEFAAMLRAAFNEPAQRRISSGSDFRDVPEGYWAAPAIKEAYQAGFMSGYPGGTFRPQQPVTRVEALASLVQTLDLNSKVPANAQVAAAPTNQTTAQAPTNQAAAQPTRQARRRMMLPLASLALLQPFVAPVRQAAAALPTQPQAAAPQTTAAKANTPQKPEQRSLQLTDFYTDADRIPQYANWAVETATRSNIVVNHPNVRELNPQRPATRGEVAAIVHQALVNQGKLPALGQNVPASEYVVRAENVVQSAK